jgi:site-specific DNA-adenine methylase
LNTLQIPCAYQGGKQRLAQKIVEIIKKENKINDSTIVYDLCCGSGAISIEFVNQGFNPKNIIMVDLSPWGLFWKMIGDGSFNLNLFEEYINEIPKDITQIKSFAQKIQNEPAINDIVYKFLILQACAFGSTATWIENNQWKKAGGLRDYWLPTENSNRKSPVNPMMPMPKTLFERVNALHQKMNGVKGFYINIDSIQIKENAIIYIDPPYKGTHHYGYSFDYDNFINKTNKNKIYLSEGIKISDNAILLSENKYKGGINGKRKEKINDEWLNIFN